LRHLKLARLQLEQRLISRLLRAQRRPQWTRGGIRPCPLQLPHCPLHLRAGGLDPLARAGIVRLFRQRRRLFQGVLLGLLNHPGIVHKTLRHLRRPAPLQAPGGGDDLLLQLGQPIRGPPWLPLTPRLFLARPGLVLAKDLLERPHLEKIDVRKSPADLPVRPRVVGPKEIGQQLPRPHRQRFQR
jgi:hypothetical protein